MSTQNDIERRVSVGDLTAEERSVGQETKLIVKGYAVRFGQRSVDLGGFTELIEAGAFTDVLKTKPDVRCLFNHDANVVLGRTTSGTLSLTEDKVGLLMECELPNTAQGRPIYESIKRGDISGQSFSFRIGKEGRVVWNGDYTERKIERIQELYDVGPVTYPAYPSTDVAARTREAAMREAEAKRNAPDGGTGKTNKPNHNENKTMNVIERRAKAKELSDAAQALLKKGAAENRETTAEERADSTKLMDEAEQHKAQADIEERASKLAASLTTGGERRSEPQTPSTPQGATVHAVRYSGITRSFKPVLFGSMERACEAAHRAGQWALAVLFGNERAAEWCRTNGVEVRAIGGGVNSKGGYLVPTELSTAVVNLMETYGIARRNCGIARMATDTLDVPIRLSGLTAYFLGEGAEGTESDKAWGNAKLVAKKIGVLCRHSTEIAEDAAINIADDIAMEAAQAFAYTEDNCLINGNGSSSYGGITGILNALLAGSKKTCATTHTSFATVTSGDITGAKGKLPSYARPGAKIFCSGAVKGEVFERLLIAAGGNTAASVAAGLPMTFNGMPIEESPLMNETDGTSKVIALIGNMSQAVALGDRRAMTMKVSDQRYLEYDQIGVLATERFDIYCHGTGTATVAGPLIQLSTSGS